MGLELADVRGELLQNVLDEWDDVVLLDDDELAPASLGNLDKGIAGHVLDALVELVHKLKELIDDGHEEAPVCPQEARVLADDVHDVGGDDRLVVLAALHLDEVEEILDHAHKETLLVFLRYETRWRVRRQN